MKVANLDSLVREINGFTNLTHADKVRFFVWYCHAHEGIEQVPTNAIGTCYDLLKLERPTNLSRTLAALTESKPKHLLRSGSGYSLVRSVREKHDEKYGGREITRQLAKQLSDLPGKLSDIAEAFYLSETLICLRNGAYRAAIVMCWNLTFSHFCSWLLSNHKDAFNRQWPIRFAELHKKARISAMAAMSDFSELKESEVIEIARSAGLISANLHKVLSEKLAKRNMAAHPSTIKISQLQAEEVVDDLINNVVLQLS